MSSKTYSVEAVFTDAMLNSILKIDNQLTGFEKYATETFCHTMDSNDNQDQDTEDCKQLVDNKLDNKPVDNQL